MAKWRTFLLAMAVGTVLSGGALAAHDADRLLDRAREAEEKGDVAAAVRLTQSALVQEPQRTDIYVTLGDLYAQQSQKDYARFYYQQALTIDPQDTAAIGAMQRLDAPPSPVANSALDKPNRGN